MSKKPDTKSSANGKNSQTRVKKIKVNDTVFDKPEEETIQANFVWHLDGAIQFIALLLEDESIPEARGYTYTEGALYHGKPGLGLQAQKYLEHHAKGITVVFTRPLATMTTQLCEDTFKRAVCCAPCIILLIGLEDAAPDVEALIIRKMKDVTDSRILTRVLATTAMCEQVSEKLRGCFDVVE